MGLGLRLEDGWQLRRIWQGQASVARDEPEGAAIAERGEELHHVAVAHLAQDLGLTLCCLLVANPHLHHQNKSKEHPALTVGYTRSPGLLRSHWQVLPTP